MVQCRAHGLLSVVSTLFCVVSCSCLLILRPYSYENPLDIPVSDCTLQNDDTGVFSRRIRPNSVHSHHRDSMGPVGEISRSLGTATVQSMMMTRGVFLVLGAGVSCVLEARIWRYPPWSCGSGWNRPSGCSSWIVSSNKWASW